MPLLRRSARTYATTDTRRIDTLEEGYEHIKSIQNREWTSTFYLDKVHTRKVDTDGVGGVGRRVCSSKPDDATRGYNRVSQHRSRRSERRRK